MSDRSRQVPYALFPTLSTRGRYWPSRSYFFDVPSLRPPEESVARLVVARFPGRVPQLPPVRLEVPGLDRPVWGVRAGVRAPLWVFYAVAEGTSEELYARGSYFYYDYRVLELVAGLLDEAVAGRGPLAPSLCPGVNLAELPSSTVPEVPEGTVRELLARIGDTSKTMAESREWIEARRKGGGGDGKGVSSSPAPRGEENGAGEGLGAVGEGGGERGAREVGRSVIGPPVGGVGPGGGEAGEGLYDLDLAGRGRDNVYFDRDGNLYWGIRPGRYVYKGESTCGLFAGLMMGRFMLGEVAKKGDHDGE